MKNAELDFKNRIEVANCESKLAVQSIDEKNAQIGELNSQKANLLFSSEVYQSQYVDQLSQLEQSRMDLESELSASRKLVEKLQNNIAEQLENLLSKNESFEELKAEYNLKLNILCQCEDINARETLLNTQKSQEYQDRIENIELNLETEKLHSKRLLQEIDSVKSELHISVTQTAKMSRTVDDISSKGTEYIVEIATLEKRLLEMENQFYSATASLKKNLHEFEELTSKHVSLTIACEEMRLSQAGLRSELDQATNVVRNQEVLKLQQSVRETESRLSSPLANQKLSILETDISHLANIIKKKDSQLFERAKSLEDFSMYVQDLEQKLDCLGRKEFEGRYVMHEDFVQLKFDAEQSHQRMVELETSSKLLEETNLQLILLKETVQTLLEDSHNLSSPDSIIQKQESQIEVLKKVWTAELGINQKLRTINSKMHADLTRSQLESQKCGIKLQTDHDRVSSKYDYTVKDLSEAREDRDRYAKALDSAELRIESINRTNQRQNEELRARCEELGIELEYTSEQLTTLIAKKKADYDLVYDLREQITQKAFKIQEGDRSLIVISGRLQDCELEIANLLQDLKNAYDENSSIKKVEESMRTRFDALSKKFDMDRKTWVLEREDIDVSNIEQLRSENFVWDRKLKEFTKETDILLADLKTGYEDETSQLKEAKRNDEAKLFEAIQSNTNYLAEVKQLRGEIKGLKSKLGCSTDLKGSQTDIGSDYLKDIESLQHDHKNHVASMDLISKRSEKSFKERENAWYTERKILHEEYDKMGTQSEVTNIINQLTLDKSSLSSKLNKCTLELNHLIQDTQVLRLQDVTLNRVLDGKGEEIKILKDELSRQNDGSYALNADSNQKIEDKLNEAEIQIRFERDRAKRLAYKIEDLKERNKKLRANPDLKKLSDQIREKDEFISSVLNKFRYLCNQILGDSMEITNAEEDYDTFQGKCEHVICEILYNRGNTGYNPGMVHRLSLWREDLRYQKHYLTLKVTDLEIRYFSFKLKSQNYHFIHSWYRWS